MLHVSTVSHRDRGIVDNEELGELYYILRSYIRRTTVTFCLALRVLCTSLLCSHGIAGLFHCRPRCDRPPVSATILVAGVHLGKVQMDLGLNLKLSRRRPPRRSSDESRSAGTDSRRGLPRTNSAARLVRYPYACRGCHVPRPLRGPRRRGPRRPTRGLAHGTWHTPPCASRPTSSRACRALHRSSSACT